MITGEKIGSKNSILLNIPSDIYEELRKVAFQKNVSVTSIVIEAIQKHLKKSK